MPVPKRKTSRGRRDRRRSHHAIKTPNLSPCPTCREMRPPHQVCPNCGNYGGREVVKIEDKERE